MKKILSISNSFGKDVIGNTYRDFDVEVTEYKASLSQHLAKQLSKQTDIN